MNQTNPLEFTVALEDEGSRLDVFLTKSLSGYSRGYVQRLIESGYVFAGEQVLEKGKLAVQSGQRIRITHLPEVTPQPTPEAVALDVLYEDEAMLVINKPAGLAVHPTQQERGVTLVHALLAHAPVIKDAIYDADSALSRQRAGIVHRLDKDTSGVLVVAKSKESMHNLAQQFQNHTVYKEYVAFLYGRLSESKTIDQPIRRKTGTGTMGISLDPEEGRVAVSHFTPEQWLTAKNGESATVVRCQIETGRTHQIRVHSKFIGHAVLGDHLYYSKPSRKFSEYLGCTRQMLHARTLRLLHPITGTEMSFTAPLPADMAAVLTKCTATASVAG